MSPLMMRFFSTLGDAAAACRLLSGNVTQFVPEMTTGIILFLYILVQVSVSWLLHHLHKFRQFDLYLTLHKVSNIMSYTFILPIIPMLFQLAQGDEFNQNDIRQISMRLAGFGLLTVSGGIIREIFTKIINRFKG